MNNAQRCVLHAACRMPQEYATSGQPERETINQEMAGGACAHANAWVRCGALTNCGNIGSAYCRLAAAGTMLAVDPASASQLAAPKHHAHCGACFVGVAGISSSSAAIVMKPNAVQSSAVSLGGDWMRNAFANGESAANAMAAAAIQSVARDALREISLGMAAIIAAR